MEKKQYIPATCSVFNVELKHLAANSPTIPVSDKSANQGNGQLSKQGFNFGDDYDEE